MFGFKPYNYERFTKDLLMKDVLLDRVGGPKPGERAPDFEARSLDGETYQLSDFQERSNVVLTFGSATCPFTAASIQGMEELFEDYADDDVQFLFCYVREAHPGERRPAHESSEDKVRAAEMFREEEDVEMPIIVDDLKGSIHKRFGKLPNATYIIDKSGRVAFRCLWTRPGVIEKALDELLERQRERNVDHAVVAGGEDRTMPSLYVMLHAHRALDRGGKDAVEDFRRELGMPGRVAISAGRALRPVAEHPVKTAATVGLTAGVVVGGILLGRFLRARRLRAPYDFDKLSTPRRTTHGEPGDYEAVGI